jgi:hypothetical protein
MNLNIGIKYVFITFIILISLILVIYFNIDNKWRAMFMTTMSIIGQSVAFLSLFFILVDRINQTENEAKQRVNTLNDMTNSYMMTIINTLSNKEKDLRSLYEELFENKPTDNKPLTYQENLFMYQLFTIILNIYRQYTITGGETGLYQFNMYDAWRNFILRIVKSAKVKQYWNNNKQLFDSLNFIQFMDEKYNI